jgi:hypothetical protein
MQLGFRFVLEDLERRRPARAAEDRCLLDMNALVGFTVRFKE